MAYTNIVFSHFEVVYCSAKKRYIGLGGSTFNDKFEAEGWGFGVNKALISQGAPSINRMKMARGRKTEDNGATL